MLKQSLNKGISKIIAIGIILVIAIIAGSIYWYYFYFPEVESGEIKCDKDKGCVLAYIGKSSCPCDPSGSHLQCVSPETAEKLKEIRKRRFAHVRCKPCPSPPLLFRCVCKNNTCLKTAECEEDKDCYPEGYKEWFYKCKNGQCTHPLEKDETANWKTYSNPEVNFTFKYPKDWEIKKEYQYKGILCQADPECKGIRNIFLNKIDDPRLAFEKEKVGIAINMPQCTGVRWDYDLPGNNWICVFDEDPEALNIYEQIRESFRLIDDEATDWKTYTLGNKCSIDYPDNWEIKHEDLINVTYLSPKEKRISEDIWVTISCFPREKGYINQNTGKDLLPLCQVGEFSLGYTEKFEAVHSKQFCTLSADGSQIGTAMFQVRGGRQRMDYYISDDEFELEFDTFNQMLSTFKFIGEIKTGMVKIDFEEMRRIQESVDEGHQPWRLNPALVAIAEVGLYGFTEEDKKTLSVPDVDTQRKWGKEIFEVKLEINHQDETYAITLFQPFRGEGKIWTILSVDKITNWKTYKDVYFSDEIQGTVYLESSNVIARIVEFPYCGAPNVGSKEYRGNFTLSFKDSSLDIGDMTFVENRPHNGKLVVNKLNPNNNQDFLTIFQYGSCNFEIARFYGYNLEKRELIQYEFRRKDGSLQNELYMSPKIEILPSKEFISSAYDNSIAKLRVAKWKFNEEENIFEEVDSWLKDL